MKHWIRGTFAIAFALAAAGIQAQASRFVGTWTMDVQGSPRQRILVITQQGENLQASFGFKDSPRLPSVESNLDADGTLTVTSRADSVIVVRLADDNTMRGKLTTNSGKVLNATAIRSTDLAQTAAAPGGGSVAQASTTTEVPALPTIAAGQTFADESRDFGVSPTKARKGPPYDVGTPMQLPGAKAVTTTELRELMTAEPRPILVDALGSAQMIESAEGMGNGIGEQRMFGKDREGFPKALERLTGGDKSRALVFYCRSSSCWHSYNASLHAIEAGYTNVMWYRGGIDAWRAAGGRTVPFRHVPDW